MILDVLKECAVFSKINPRELEHISELGRIIDYQDGDLIFSAGDDADFIYIVNTGEVKLKYAVNILNAPMDLTAYTIKDRGHLGWSAFTKPYKYTLSSYAVGKTQLLQFRSDKLRKLCDSNENVGYIMMKNINTMISTRFARVNGLLQHVIQGNYK